MTKTKLKRMDGRAWDELRPMEAKVGVVPRADGSAMFRIGNTVAYAAVYGPRDLHPKFMQNPETGIVRVEYNMMPFSGHGERVRPGGSRRSRELSFVIERSLLPVLELKDYPNTVVDVFIEFPQTDAGTRCAGITAAAMALADAGLIMKDMVAAVAVGRIAGQIVVDLTYDEEALPDEKTPDMPVAVMPNTGDITLLQLDGEVSEEELAEMLEVAKKKCKEIYEVQKAALKEKYKIA